MYLHNDQRPQENVKYVEVRNTLAMEAATCEVNGTTHVWSKIDYRGNCIGQA